MHRISMVALVLLTACVPGTAELAGTGRNPEHPGFGLYQQMCAECHGVEADGRGPEAPNLTPPPSDLTRLRAEDGRAMRAEDLIPVIDGRPTFRAHGDGAMPVWGWILVPDEENADVRERKRAELVRSLADYLVSIQRPPEQG